MMSFDDEDEEDDDEDEEVEEEDGKMYHFDSPVKKKMKLSFENDDYFSDDHSPSSSSFSASTGSDENYVPSEEDSAESLSGKVSANEDMISTYNKGRGDSSDDNINSSKSYFRTLEKSVQDRTFDLSKIKDGEVIPTGRTIKSLKAWRGHWPPLREFLQNTVDHLSLLDSKTGRRRDCLSLKLDKPSLGIDAHTVSFTCEDTIVCRFEVEPHKLVIYQQYTYPIATRAVDTGVLDTTKALGLTAGNFGDGFKSAIVALMSDPKNVPCNVTWKFYAVKERIKVKWSFQGLKKERIATFEGCKMLQIAIDKKPMTEGEISQYSGMNSSSGYVMEQHIEVKDIGKSFLEKALPSFVVFWDLKEETLISILRRNSRRKEGNHFLAPALQQPQMFGGKLNGLKPRSGIYIQGIFVCKSRITDGIMSFYGKRLEVVGRDRNDVDEDEMLKATIYILKHTKNLPYLRKLMEPLRGGQDCNKSTDDSWLLKPKYFFNRIIQKEKDFILYNVLKIPRNSIFISNRAMKGQEKLFFNWAKRFLEKKGRALTPIPDKANALLFKSVDENKIRKICARILNKENKSKRRHNISAAQTIIRKFIAFLGINDVKASNIVISKEVEIPFSYDRRIYIPQSKLNQEMTITIIAMCFQKLQTFDGEAEIGTYTALIRAISDKLSIYNECTKETADKIVCRARSIKKNYSNFVNTGHEGADTLQDTSPYFEIIDNKIQCLVELIRRESSNIQSENIVEGSVLDEVTSHRIKHEVDQIEELPPMHSENTSQPSILNEVNAGPSFGGGYIYCDERTAKMIKHELFKETKKKKILILREALDEACNRVVESIPSTSTLIDERLRHAYDGKNREYEAFCSGTYIYINLHAFHKSVSSEANSPQLSLVYDFVILLTGEISHLLEPNPYRGKVWKETHMKMINQVMQYLERF